MLDVRRSDEGPLVVSPAVLQDGRELQVRRIGLGRSRTWVVPLGTRAWPYPNIESVSAHPAAQQGAAPASIEGSPQPVADEHRFTTDYVPQRQKVAISSIDGSVSLPEYQPPLLTLLATFKEEHRLRLDWAWEYRIGDSVVTFDLDEPVKRPSVRDVAEERRQLEQLPLPYDRISPLPRFSAASPVAHPPAECTPPSSPLRCCQVSRKGVESVSSRRAGLPRDRSTAGDRGLHCRERRRGGLVRPPHSGVH